MTLRYSSPQALLNRYFRGKNKFKYNDNDSYENNNWLLVWIEHEIFVVEKRIKDYETGADYFDEVFYGELTDCVKYIKKEGL